MKELNFSDDGTQADNCLLWAGAIATNGYGQSWEKGKHAQAHRRAWEKANGPIPEGLFIDHICGTKACVNVEHLRVVTRKQNNEHHTRARSNNTSGYRGVGWDGAKGKWRARITHYGRARFLGHFDSPEAANEAAVAARNATFTHNDEDR